MTEPLLWIALGAAAGAAARYLVGRAFGERETGGFPWATLTVNTVGSFLLGALTAGGQAVDPALGAALGAGFCGALTTYSTFAWEAARLVEEGAWRTSLASVVGGLALGLTAAAAGWALVAGFAAPA